MSSTVSQSRESQETAGAQQHAGSWRGPIVVGIVLASCYLANGRDIPSYDTEPTTLTAYTLMRGESIYLDRFRIRLHKPNGDLLDYVVRARGHLMSPYPIAPAVVAVPLMLPQAYLLDLVRPDWDRNLQVAWSGARLFGKHAAALLAALAGMLTCRVLRLLGFGRTAVAATLGGFLGSDMWTIGSQSLWQHGPAALALIAAIWLLIKPEPSRLRLLAAGTATAALVTFRALDLLFAAVIFAWVLVYLKRRAVWFLPGPILLGALLLAYNVWYFGNVAGGQVLMEAMHPQLHHVAGPWAGNLLDGMAGTLVSPSRGLFVYCPWIALAVGLSVVTWPRLGRATLVRWLVLALIPNLLIFSKYAVWWAGHTFGPRYWTDVTPLFTILLAAALEWSWMKLRPMALLLTIAIVFAVAVQAIGAFYFPSTWNLQPKNIDVHHERLWEWRDNEVTRCLLEATNSRG